MYDSRICLRTDALWYFLFNLEALNELSEADLYVLFVPSHSQGLKPLMFLVHTLLHSINQPV